MVGPLGPVKVIGLRARFARPPYVGAKTMRQGCDKKRPPTVF